MLRNYLKIALRNIKRQKVYSFINIAGLAIGLACTILILLWIQDELSYDRFHKNADDIHRVIKIWRKGEISHQARTPAPLASALKEEIPEIIQSARFLPAGRTLVKYGESMFYENRGILADPSIFDMFTFPLVKGDLKTVLSNPTSIVLTEALVAKYFGDEEPLGKILRVDNQYDFSVTGVMKNIPMNSHLQFDFVVPFTLIGEEALMDWHNTIYYSYVLLEKNTSYQEVSQKISNYLKKPIPESTSSLYLQPLKRIHLYSSYLRGRVAGSSDINFVYIFSAMAFFILLIACINFMNLATARSGNRAKEIGIRKVAGARRTNIIKQFFGESFLLTFIALIFAIVMVELLLPAFCALSGKKLTLDISGNVNIILGIIGIALVTGIVSGSYPALLISSFQPAKALKGSLRSGLKGYRFRRILVVFQFFLTITFIIGAIVIYNQLDYMRNRKLGFDREHLVYIRISNDIRKRYKSFKDELLQNTSILNITASSSLPSWGTDIGTEGVNWPGKNPDEDFLMRGVGVDHDFIETFGIEMAEGRSFSEEFVTDKANYILNEKAIGAMKMESPVGKQLSLMGNTGTIIGVVKNYHFKSLHNSIEPLLLRLYAPRWLNFIFVRIESDNISQTIRFLEGKWKIFSPDFPFEYNFVDELLDNMYTVEQRIGRVFRYLTILSIFISCLGLFGLASFMAEQRTKEIGIRKVLGASVSGIVLLLAEKFTRWVVIANVVAWPVAYFTMNKWLQYFAYRINIGWWTFILAGALALVIALLTVSYQAIRAAIANPIEALRYE